MAGPLSPVMHVMKAVGSETSSVMGSASVSLSSPITGCPGLMLSSVKKDLGKSSGTHTMGVVARPPSAPSNSGAALAVVPAAVHSPTLTGHLMTPLSLSCGTSGDEIKIGLLTTMTLTAGGVTTLAAASVTGDVRGSLAVTSAVAFRSVPRVRHGPVGLKTGPGEEQLLRSTLRPLTSILMRGILTCRVPFGLMVLMVLLCIFIRRRILRLSMFVRLVLSLLVVRMLRPIVLIMRLRIRLFMILRWFILRRLFVRPVVMLFCGRVLLCPLSVLVSCLILILSLRAAVPSLVPLRAPICRLRRVRFLSFVIVRMSLRMFMRCLFRCLRRLLLRIILVMLRCLCWNGVWLRRSL